MTWRRVYLGVCLAVLAGSVFLLIEGVRLGHTPWPRLLSVVLWTSLSLRAWQALRSERQ